MIITHIVIESILGTAIIALITHVLCKKCDRTRVAARMWLCSTGAIGFVTEILEYQKRVSRNEGVVHSGAGAQSVPHAHFNQNTVPTRKPTVTAVVCGDMVVGTMRGRYVLEFSTCRVETRRAIRAALRYVLSNGNPICLWIPCRWLRFVHPTA